MLTWSPGSPTLLCDYDPQRVALLLQWISDTPGELLFVYPAPPTGLISTLGVSVGVKYEWCYPRDGLSSTLKFYVWGGTATFQIFMLELLHKR